MTDETSARDELARHASAPQPGILRELTALLRDSKKWWLAPILIVFLLLALVAVLGAGGAAPFIYTLF